ncbi:DUF6656 family protein [Hoeflea sp. EC-HK425]|uniref:DUF6656 family protein n=1 Tax=Hoeflea sp. EC-HK425 TaxID=2038388 RepID=UPI0012533F93|nr:DUF6656 family protein [Hoeflea sp. EC-HK425]VVT09121.1 conserved hypothetical protein [Hoeflea sp. EC-HK425]|tara:strand:- start:1908 stop:2612 length:705 start_codon:yes stop_codon:yes gene_type:complete
MSMFRYYAAKSKGQALVPAKAIHTNFLRTGRINRQDDWVAEERRYLTEEEVAERTGKRLEKAGRKTHQRLNGFHRKIRFPEIIFHKTLATAPHLGYVHVTASKADFADHKDVTWGFYIANFSAEIGAESVDDIAAGKAVVLPAETVAAGAGDSMTEQAAREHFFHHVKPGYSRMYFAVAMKNAEAGENRRQVINRDIRDNGVLFRTADPKTALKNVLMLGARNAELRKIVEAIG